MFPSTRLHCILNYVWSCGSCQVATSSIIIHLYASVLAVKWTVLLRYIHWMYIKALSHIAFYQSIKRFKRFQCCYLGHVFKPLHTRKHRFVLTPGWIVSLSRFTGLLHSVSSGALTNVTAAVLTPTQRVSQELVSRGPAVTQTPSSLTQTMEMRKLNLYQMFIRVVERIDPRRQKLL